MAINFEIKRKEDNFMNLKKNFIISLIMIFALSFLSHFMYDWFPNTFTSIFFPVNESIFEHTKMVFTTMMVWGLISYFLLKKEYKTNYLSALLFSTITTIIVLVIIFTPTYYLMNKKENMVITLVIYFIAIVVGQIVNYFILKRKNKLKILNIISLILIPVIFTVYGLLTYYPIKASLWRDYENNKYGIYTRYE